MIEAFNLLLLMASEAELMRTCAPLYAPIALESFANVILFFTFMYLVLVIQSRGELNTPGLACLRLVWKNIVSTSSEAKSSLAKWAEMPHAPLKDRFALFRKLNTGLCAFTACVSLLATTRWLHIGNVNGFRYLGYAVTCPVMQAELVMMIAPIMPCYRLNVLFVAFATFATMISGYSASLMSGDLWDGSFEEFLSSWDIGTLQPTQKLWVLTPSIVGISILTFVQIPYLAFLYTIKGGVSAGLPYNYRKLLLLVAVTWLTFPVWWFLNWQGMSIITDAKLNGAGFCLLNVISKGLFTFVVISSMKWHKKRGWTTKAVSNGRRPSTLSVNRSASASSSAATASAGLPISQRASEKEDNSSKEAESSVTSQRTTRYLPGDIPWFIHVLLPFDSLDEEEVEESSPNDTFRMLGAEGDECFEPRFSRRSSRGTMNSTGSRRRSYCRDDVGKLLQRVERLCSALEMDGLAPRTPRLSMKRADSTHSQVLEFTSDVVVGSAVSAPFPSLKDVAQYELYVSGETADIIIDRDDLETGGVNMAHLDMALDALSAIETPRHVAHAVKSSNCHRGHDCLDTQEA